MEKGRLGMPRPLAEASGRLTEGVRDVAEFRPLWQTTQKHRRHPSVARSQLSGCSLPWLQSTNPSLRGSSNSFTTGVLIFPEPLLGERA